MNDFKPQLRVKGIRVPGCMDPFEMSVRAVLGQQITVKAPGTLAGRIAENLGTPMNTEIDGLSYAFPSPEDIIALDGRIEDHLGPLSPKEMLACAQGWKPWRSYATINLWNSL